MQPKRILYLLVAGSSFLSGTSGATIANLVSVTDTALEETNGCGDAGPSAATGSFVVLTGSDTAVGCGDHTLLQDFINGNGKSINTIGEADVNLVPSLAAANEKTGMVASVAYYDWSSSKKGIVRLSSSSTNTFEDFEFASSKSPLAVAVLNDRNVAMIFEDTRDVIFYQPKNGNLVRLSRVALDDDDDDGSPMKTLKTMIYDSPADALFVGGNVKGGNRGLARVDVDDGDGRLVWVSIIARPTGTAKLHLRRKSFTSRAYEIILLSRSFFARVDANNGDELETSSYGGGDGFTPFLPRGKAPQAAYDPTRDVIWTTSGTTLRQHDADTGESAGYFVTDMISRKDLEFYHDPPSAWDIKLMDSDPATDTSNQPPFCGPSPYPDHPDVEKNKYKGVDDDSNCDRSDDAKCRQHDLASLGCKDGDICCINGGCCILDDYYFANWARYGDANAQDVYVTANGKIHVVVKFSGSVDDEDEYYKYALATFDADSGGDDECAGQSNKSKCRATVTSTGCFWSKSKGCIKASKCSKIKKNQDACLGATKYDCEWWMRDEKRHVCNDDKMSKGCKMARDKTACRTNGCVWENNDCVES